MKLFRLARGVSDVEMTEDLRVDCAEQRGLIS